MADSSGPPSRPVRPCPRTSLPRARRPVPSPPPATAVAGRSPARSSLGFSAMVENRDGTFWAQPDNGFGTKANSADFLLRIYQVRPRLGDRRRWPGSIEVLRFLSLRDPDHKSLPDREPDTPDRLLTGADFDIESMSVPGRLLLDRRGVRPVPPALRRDGAVLAGTGPVRRRQVAGEPYARHGERPGMPASRGFEAMAASTDGRYLYPIVEGAFLDDTDQRRRYIYQYDTARARYTGRTWQYQADHDANVVGDAFRWPTRVGCCSSSATTSTAPAAVTNASTRSTCAAPRRDGFVREEAGPRPAAIANPDRSAPPPATASGTRSPSRWVVETILRAARRPDPDRQRQQLPGQRRPYPGHPGRHRDVSSTCTGRGRRKAHDASSIGHRGAAATGPSTPWRRTSRPSCSAPTTSSPTWSPPRTGCSSPATRTRSAAPPTSPTTPEFADRRTTKAIDGVTHHRLVHRGLHPGRAEDAAGQGTDPRRSGRPTPPSTACTQSPPSTRCSTWPATPAPATAAGRRLPGDQAPDLLRRDRPARSRSRCSTRSRPTATTRRRPVFIQSFETGNLQRAGPGHRLPLVQLADCTGRRTTWSPPATRAPTPTW